MKPTVLFVDDEDIILQGLKNQLKPILSESCNLEFTTEVVDAIEILEECDLLDIPSIVFSDWLMPGADGAIFLREVHYSFPKSKKVILTGQASEKEMQELMMEVDVERAIRKPWDKEDIVSLINELVVKNDFKKKIYILCVDDEESILISLKNQLKQFFGINFIIETAQSGEEALELLKELEEENNLPHLILSDQIMPGIAGDELLAKVKTLYPHIVRILLTGQASQKDIINAINHAGLYRFIEKPWNIDDLNLTIKSGLESYDAEERLKVERKRVLNLYLSLEEKVKQRTEKIMRQNTLIENQHLSITQSINYAKKIQDAILSPKSNLTDFFSDSFILFQPKDIVSGDFYLFWNTGPQEAIIATIDCTGHGVPGAFLTIICKFVMELAAKNEDSSSLTPDKLLYEVNRMMITYLSNHENSKYQIMDGMDIALCKIDYKNKLLSFSGAYHSLILVHEEDILEIRGDRRSIGFTPKGIESHTGEFKLHIHEFNIGDRIYMMSDGFVDQFGGLYNKKYTKRRLINLLSNIQHKNFETQSKLLKMDLDKWKGNEEQTDDIVMIGLEF
ncbi:MAG: sigma-B regulation protein RsbU (phosphoserine phosphatase) [Crocinitomix sp.]|jgi:sigma-B regulation protein RsbU (phosphoserine phosphatase)